jgi:predicted membrane protein
MKTKIIANTLFSVGALFALAWLPTASLGGTRDGVLNFSDTPLLRPLPTITTFDAPGAGTGPGQGTIPYAITPAGLIGGQYVDSSDVNHAFLRARGGSITTFDVPGAEPFGTVIRSINPAGVVTGWYADADNTAHGYVRALDGTITTFDAPGGGTGTFLGTFAEDINPAGVIAGIVEDDSFTVHGFLRGPDGTITTFDAPGAGTGNDRGTWVFAVDNLNPAGAISGTSLDDNDVWHGFLRAPDGTITTFDVPGAGTEAYQGTLDAGINQRGTIAGEMVDANNVAHGFVRTSDGTITTFDVPGAGTGPGDPGCSATDTCPGTVTENINNSGAITGKYNDDNSVSHGFLRLKSGLIITFDVPGAGTGSGQGSTGFCNNPVNAITGPYIDASDVSHGFLRSPQHSPAQ